MITEDYVSFETAKLLKEKGFDAECQSHYYPCHYPDGSIKYHRDKSAQSGTKIWYNVYSLKNLPKDHYLAPTLQMAMKWMREVHKIAINIGWGEVFEENYQWWCIILNQNNGEILRESEYSKTYEQACEAAIKYCLENLI